MKRVLLTLLALCILSSSSFANQTEDKIRDAISLYKSANYNECIENLNTIISQEPDYPVAYYYLGLSYAKKGQKDLAIKNYNKVISTSNDKSLKSMAKAAKDCLGTSGFTGIDAQLSITNNSRGEDFVNKINKEITPEKKVAEKFSKPINQKTEKQEKIPSDSEIGAAIMTLKKAGLWNDSSFKPNSQPQQNQQQDMEAQQNMMAKMYMQQMTQQMNNPAYLMMNMNGNNNFNNNNMMNMLPFLMNSQDGGNKAANQQLIQSMMMSQMMPNLDFSFNSDKNR